MSIDKEMCRECNLGPCLPGQKRCEGLNEELASLREPDTTDFYSPGERVSIEEARGIQLKLQRELDDAVTKENIFPEDPDLVIKRGLLPCKRVKDSY